jgi:hypothetical protein
MVNFSKSQSVGVTIPPPRFGPIFAAYRPYPKAYKPIRYYSKMHIWDYSNRMIVSPSDPKYIRKFTDLLYDLPGFIYENLFEFGLEFKVVSWDRRFQKSIKYYKRNLKGELVELFDEPYAGTYIQRARLIVIRNDLLEYSEPSPFYFLIGKAYRHLLLEPLHRLALLDDQITVNNFLSGQFVLSYFEEISPDYFPTCFHEIIFPKRRAILKESDRTAYRMLERLFVLFGFRELDNIYKFFPKQDQRVF